MHEGVNMRFFNHLSIILVFLNLNANAQEVQAEQTEEIEITHEFYLII